MMDILVVLAPIDPHPVKAQIMNNNNGKYVNSFFIKTPSGDDILKINPPHFLPPFLGGEMEYYTKNKEKCGDNYREIDKNIHMKEVYYNLFF